jgi:hypothetical protein
MGRGRVRVAICVAVAFTVFGRNLQCELVIKVDTQEECHLSHACSLQAEEQRRETQWHPTCKFLSKRAPCLDDFVQGDIQHCSVRRHCSDHTGLCWCVTSSRWMSECMVSVRQHCSDHTGLCWCVTSSRWMSEYMVSARRHCSDHTGLCWCVTSSRWMAECMVSARRHCSDHTGMC